MTAVLVVQVTGDHIVDMITVPDRRMATQVGVNVVIVVMTAVVVRRAAVGMIGIDRDLGMGGHTSRWPLPP